MAKQIIDRARFEIAYWVLCAPGFELCRRERFYGAGVAYLRAVRPIVNGISPGALP